MAMNPYRVAFGRRLAVEYRTPVSGLRPLHVPAIRPAAPTRPKAPSARDHVRAQSLAIAGYAALFGVPAWRSDGVREILEAGAFQRAIALNSVYLLRDHADGTLLACNRGGTLHLEEDRIGLWFEAALPDTRLGSWLFCRIAAGGASGVSVGSDRTRGRMVNGVLHADHVDAWEISLVLPPNRPARAGTWVAPLRMALRRRRD
jgi:HK97 family phage prohead protease